MATSPFASYIDDAREQVQHARDETGVEWEVSVSETRVKTTWVWDSWAKREDPSYTEIDCPTITFSCSNHSVKVYENDSGSWQVDNDFGLTISSSYDSLDEALESAYGTVSSVGT